jgi:hypothetical protein
MAFELPKLPYAYDALEPHIDARTMEIHHTKHHQAYTDNLNKAIAGTEMENMSIEDLPVGTNRVSFSRAKTDRGIEYRLRASEKGWTLILKGEADPGADYYLNGNPVSSTGSGIRMRGTNNLVLVVPPATRP